MSRLLGEAQTLVHEVVESVSHLINGLERDGYLNRCLQRHGYGDGVAADHQRRQAEPSVDRDQVLLDDFDFGVPRLST